MKKLPLTDADYVNFCAFAAAIVADSAADGCVLSPVAFARSWFRSYGLPTERVLWKIIKQYVADVRIDPAAVRAVESQILGVFVKHELRGVRHRYIDVEEA